MIFLTVNKIPAFVIEKLEILFQLLKERKTEYEVFAGQIKNKQLRTTVLLLAQETNQYARELSSQIEVMGGNTGFYNCESIFKGKVLQTLRSILVMPDEEDIMKSCEISETKMIQAYKSILTIPVLHENLRRLINCQMEGFTCAFMQLRLLNSSL